MTEALRFSLDRPKACGDKNGSHFLLLWLAGKRSRNLHFFQIDFGDTVPDVERPAKLMKQARRYGGDAARLPVEQVAAYSVLRQCRRRHKSDAKEVASGSSRLERVGSFVVAQSLGDAVRVGWPLRPGERPGSDGIGRGRVVFTAEDGSEPVEAERPLLHLPLTAGEQQYLQAPRTKGEGGAPVCAVRVGPGTAPYDDVYALLHEHPDPHNGPTIEEIVSPRDLR